MPPEGALMAPQNGMVDGAMMVQCMATGPSF